MSAGTDGLVAPAAPGEMPDSGVQPPHTGSDVSSQVHTGRYGHMGTLFRQMPHPHQPRNVNLLHKAEQAAEGTNTRIAIELTKRVGTMWTAYTFCVIAIVGLFAILGWFDPVVALLVAWASQTLIQLVLLPVIMVGQNVLGRKAELQAEEQFNTTLKTYHDIEVLMQHLSAQDAELLRHTEMLINLLESSGCPPEKLAALQIGLAAPGNTGAASGAALASAPADTLPTGTGK